MHKISMSVACLLLSFAVFFSPMNNAGYSANLPDELNERILLLAVINVNIDTTLKNMKALALTCYSFARIIGDEKFKEAVVKITIEKYCPTNCQELYQHALCLGMARKPFFKEYLTKNMFLTCYNFILFKDSEPKLKELDNQILFFINAGVDINTLDEERTVLMRALLWARNDLVKKLLSINGIDTNIKNAYGRTALMQAARFGNTQGVALLLQAGADITLSDGQGLTALELAHNHGYFDIDDWYSFFNLWIKRYEKATIFYN